MIRRLLWRPLSALLEPSWGTVGAYQFDMFKKHESNATAVKLGPAAGGQSWGETLSKQVYLGRVLKSGSSGPTTRITLRYGSALRPEGSVAGLRAFGLLPPAPFLRCWNTDGL